MAAARSGTLFVNDVTDLPAAVQARLARLVRDGEARMNGESVALEVRFIAGAPASIDVDVAENRLRADLYRRLAASRIDVPPLRDRAADVPIFASRLLEEACAGMKMPPRMFTQAALALLGALQWPGNIAELRDVVLRVATASTASAVHVEHLLPALQPSRARAPFRPARNLREARLQFERDYIAAVLEHHGGRMSAAARTLGIQRPNLYRKARQLGISVTRQSGSQ
jgi:two-component system nitrogen regulation response regulator NtrX